MVYIRSIDELRWRNPHYYDSDIISDISTTDHEISVWSYIECDEDSRNKAILALAMRRSHFSDFFYVEISDREIEKLHFGLNEKPGDTYFVKYKNLHRNIEICTVVGLLKLARVIKKKINKTEANYVSVQDSEALLRSYSDELSLEELKQTKYKNLI